jgi:hypothetical protein
VTDGYLLVLCTQAAGDDEAAAEVALSALRPVVRRSPGGVLVVADCLAPWAPAPLATVTRRRADGALLGATSWFGPLTRPSALAAVCRWLDEGGPAAGSPPADLDDHRVAPAPLLGAFANPN